MKINAPFKLPCGAELSNRIAKAAMTERLATSNQQQHHGIAILQAPFKQLKSVFDNSSPCNN